MAERAGDLLDRFFEHHGLGAAGQAYATFFRSWGSIAGQDIASHSDVADIRDHAVVVEVDHPAWMQLIQLRQDGILKRIREKHKSFDIRSIQLRLVDRRRGQDLSAPRKPVTRERVVENKAALREDERQASNGESDELKKALTRLKRQVEQRARSEDR